MQDQEQQAADAQPAAVIEYSEQVNLTLLDDVFSQFMASVRLQGTPGCTVAQLMSAHDTNFARYTHNNVEYLSTVQRCNFEGAPCVFVRLSNNGFVTSNRSSGITTRQLPETSVRSSLERLCQVFQGTHAEVQAFYHSADEEERLEVKLWPSDPRHPQVEISFERGNPYVDHLYPRIRL